MDGLRACSRTPQRSRSSTARVRWAVLVATTSTKHLIANHTTGTAAGCGYTVNGADRQRLYRCHPGCWCKHLQKGDVITFVAATAYPQGTKGGYRRPATVRGDGGLRWRCWHSSFALAIYTSGGRQNVVAAGIANGVAVAKIGGASAIYKPSLAFHKDAFAFATADLVMPQGVDFASRQVLDGISMRIVRQYDINNDSSLAVWMCCTATRPSALSLPCRILSNNFAPLRGVFLWFIMFQSTPRGFSGTAMHLVNFALWTASQAQARADGFLNV